MDIVSMASGILAAQAGNTQMQVATSILKSNADAEKFAVQALLGDPTASSSASFGPGVGGQLDKTA